MIFWEQIRILEKIGSGAYASVYATTNEKYVCKVQMNDEEEEGISESALREMSALKKLAHSPYIVECSHVYLTKQGQGTCTIFLPRYNENLKEYVIRNSCTSQQIQTIMYRLISGIRDMQTSGVLHRDIKSANILISEPENVVIADLGMSRFNHAEVSKLSGDEIQTLHSRAPEIILGEVNYSFAIDMWSLGILMFEIMTKFKTSTFRGDSAIGQLFLIFKTLGTPDNSTWKGVESMMNYKASFPKWSKLNISEKYKIDPCAADLITRLLTLNPKERISAENALLHPYFSNSECSSIKKEIETIQNIDRIDQTYMIRRKEIDENMRSEIVDQIIGKAIDLKLEHSTFFLALQYADLYLMSKRVQVEVTTRKLTVLFITSLLLANKVNEIIPPSIRNYLHLSGEVYSRESIILMEIELIETLGHSLYRETDYTHFMKLNIQCYEERSDILKKLYSFALHLDYRKFTFQDLIKQENHADNRYTQHLKIEMIIDDRIGKTDF